MSKRNNAHFMTNNLANLLVCFVPKIMCKICLIAKPNIYGKMLCLRCFVIQIYFALMLSCIVCVLISYLVFMTLRKTNTNAHSKK